MFSTSVSLFVLSKSGQNISEKLKDHFPMMSLLLRIKDVAFCIKYCQALVFSHYPNRTERITNEFHEKIELLKRFLISL